MRLKSRHFQWTELVIDSGMCSHSKYICLYLATFMNSKTDMAFPGLARMEHELSLSRKTILKYIDEAEQHGYLNVIRGDRIVPNKYYSRLPKQIRETMVGSVPRPLPMSEEVVELRAEGSGTQGIKVVEDVHYNKQRNKQRNKQKHIGGKFTPPTQKEVLQYITEKGSRIDAEDFIDFYESKGWMVGKNKMKCWKSAANRWERKNRGTGNGNRNNQSEAERYLEQQASEVFN